MKILALDGALGFFAVAVRNGDLVLAERSTANDALEAGLGRIARLLGACGLTLAELDRVAVGVGPGSFTGVRIALSFAKSLAYATGVPLTGDSSYDVLTPPAAALPCLTVVTGRPGVICARLRTAGASWTACGRTRPVLAELLSRLEPDEAVTIVTNTEDVLPEIGERRIGTQLAPPHPENPAIVIAELVRHRKPSPSPHGLAPDYGEVPAVTMSALSLRKDTAKAAP